MAGTLVVTSSDIGMGYTKYSLAWTSDAAGNVNANAFDIKRGRIHQLKYVPGSGGTQPTNNYVFALPDADGADLSSGGGALSNAAATVSEPAAKVFIEAQTITPTISAAGNAKTGRVDLIVGP